MSTMLRILRARFGLMPRYGPRTGAVMLVVSDVGSYWWPPDYRKS